MMTLFKNSYAEKPASYITIEQLFEYIRDGKWEKEILKLRNLTNPAFYKKVKEALPGITVSAEFKSRNRNLPLNKKLKSHSGYICLDIDRKDNLKMRTQDLIDKDCLMQYVSCSGEGIKIIYRCNQVNDAATHRRIYDAAVKRLEDKGIKLKIDPIVKSIASLQYVSYDPQCFYFPKTKLIVKPLPAIKLKKSKPSADQKKDAIQLTEYIKALGKKDVTQDYEDWLNIAFGLTYTLGETGRPLFHLISKNYKQYAKGECDEKYDACMERQASDIDRPITINSVYAIINKHLPAAQIKLLNHKFGVSHAVGIGEEVDGEQFPELAGLVRYKLFLFKVMVTKKEDILKLHKINLLEFEKLLKQLGFYRYNKIYIHIKDNIIETADAYDVIRIVTTAIDGDGDYKFIYKGQEQLFSWEEISQFWREIRASSSIFNQLASAIGHWDGEVLHDTKDVSYIPYRNGVLQISSKERKLIPYKMLKAKIWKERILPREFKYTSEVGMFERFFENVCYRGKLGKVKNNSYLRSLWYFGYMLHGFKIKSIARAWMLYDIKAGNNGRTGKTIIGQAVGYIRNMTIIDGKQLDLRNNRFAFQKVNPWTQVIFIDDPHKGMSLTPLFNMITGETDAERKGMDPITLNVKFMFASNWIMEMEGTSETGRQFVTQLDDFYVRWAKDHDHCLQPLVKLHGKEFFTGWNDYDWNMFDSFCVRALQHYLASAIPEDKINGNAAQVRFIQQHDKELFYELTSTFLANVKVLKDEQLAIGQKVLINCVKESGENGQQKAGRIVREYLKCIGNNEISITSIIVGSLHQMAYRLDKQLNELTFGEASELLKNGKK